MSLNAAYWLEVFRCLENHHCLVNEAGSFEINFRSKYTLVDTTLVVTYTLQLPQSASRFFIFYFSDQL